MDNKTPKADADLFYPVLTPFKREGNIVKPPVFLQLSADDAAPYFAAQVIGEGVESPAHEADAPRYSDEALEFIAKRHAERLEAERLEAERLEAERVEAQRLEAEQLMAGDREAARLEAEAKADRGKTITPDTTPKPEVKPAAGEPAAGKTGSKPKPAGK